MLSKGIAARGRPVYGGGTYAPNVGSVSANGAKGYLQRELKKRNRGASVLGRDGKSDTRSGVAKAALARSAPIKPANNKSWSKAPTSPGIKTDTSDPTRPITDKPIKPTGGGKPAPTPPEPTTPTVVVNDTGQLELPFDQQFSSEVLAALEQYNSELLDLQFDQQTTDLAYQQDRRNAGLEYEDLQRSTLSDNAARGTAFSSGYGLATANNARTYQNKMNDLDASYSLFGKDNELRRAGIISAFQRMLSQSALDYGNDLSEDAGNLGYGESPVPPTNGGGTKATGHGTGGSGPKPIVRNPKPPKKKKKKGK
jgi:hypothetical protein